MGGHDPKQTGSKEGREEGDGAGEAPLRLLDLRPVRISRWQPAAASATPLESSLSWS